MVINNIGEKKSLINPILSIIKHILPKKVNERTGYKTTFNKKGSTPILTWILLLGKKILNKQEPGIKALPKRNTIALK